MHDHGYELGNLDATIILQRPKLSPHKERIRENLCQLLDAHPSTINIKVQPALYCSLACSQCSIILYAQQVALHMQPSLCDLPMACPLCTTVCCMLPVLPLTRTLYIACSQF